MNSKVKIGGVITLPPDVVEALKLEPGSDVSFSRVAAGEFVLRKAPEARSTRDEIRRRVAAAGLSARTGLSSEFANMTTDEIMEFVRGD